MPSSRTQVCANCRTRLPAPAGCPGAGAHLALDLAQRSDRERLGARVWERTYQRVPEPRSRWAARALLRLTGYGLSLVAGVLLALLTSAPLLVSLVLCFLGALPFVIIFVTGDERSSLLGDRHHQKQPELRFQGGSGDDSPAQLLPAAAAAAEPALRGTARGEELLAAPGAPFRCLAYSLELSYHGEISLADSWTDGFWVEARDGRRARVARGPIDLSAWAEPIDLEGPLLREWLEELDPGLCEDGGALPSFPADSAVLRVVRAGDEVALFGELRGSSSTPADYRTPASAFDLVGAAQVERLSGGEPP